MVTRLHLPLEHAPQVVGTARRDAAAAVRAAWPELAGVEDLVDDVRLVTSELVGNAVRHGEPPVTLDVLIDDTDGRHRVVVTCHDGGPWDGSDPSPSSGRGLVIVRALCTTLTIDAGHDHTTVVATLER
jgi:anti-sigma regulatory factor (Ser/Thr protein kinase)